MPDAAVSPLVKKLQVKPGKRVLVLAPEPVVDDALVHLPDGARRVTRGPADVVLVFVRDTKALAREAPRALAALAEDAVLWIAYPKISSGVKTDLTRDRGWDAVVSQGFVVVSLVAIDATWSAMRYKRDEGLALTAARAARVAARSPASGAARPRAKKPTKRRA